MAYQSADSPMTKHEYAASLAAAMAYLTLQQQDSVGLAQFDETITGFIRPSNNSHHWQMVVKELAGRTGSAKTSIGRVMQELAERLGQRTLIILISDLFDDADEILKGFRYLRYRHHELIVWNLWDPAELSFPFQGPTLFAGLESTGKILVEPRSLRARYLEQVERFQSQLRAGCGRMHVDYSVFTTSTPLDQALSGYLATRSSRLRQRSSRVMGRG